MNRLNYVLFISLIALLGSCATQRVSTIVGGEYKESSNVTEYFVLPLGTAEIPGKWMKTSYSSVSHQQFFKNQDSVEIALAFNRYDGYEFNAKGTKKGFEFVEAYYEWDSKYFMDSYGLQRLMIERDSLQQFVVYRIYGGEGGKKTDTYFLIGNKNGNVSNFSVSVTDKWTEEEKINFLKHLYLNDKSQ